MIQRNYSYSDRYLLNLTTKCIAGQTKGFSFLFCTACDAKSTKGGER